MGYSFTDRLSVDRGHSSPVGILIPVATQYVLPSVTTFARYIQPKDLLPAIARLVSDSDRSSVATLTVQRFD
jgi:hypothetical protein